MGVRDNDIAHNEIHLRISLRDKGIKVINI